MKPRTHKLPKHEENEEPCAFLVAKACGLLHFGYMDHKCNGTTDRKRCPLWSSGK